MNDSVENGGADIVPAEQISTPESQVSNDFPSNEVRPPEPTPRQALDRAFDKFDPFKEDVEEADPNNEVQQSAERERDAQGRFVTKQPKTEAKPQEGQPEQVVQEDQPKPLEDKQASFAEAPSRFSADAKAAWKDAPPAIKAEIHRAVKEMEAGIEKHRESAQQWERLAPFHQLAQQYGTNVGDALQRYVAADQKLNTDLVGGLREIVNHYGYSLEDIAAHVLNQPADQRASRDAAELRALKQEITELKRGFGGVRQTIEQQHFNENFKAVNDFAANHPRFEEVAGEMKFLLDTGRARSLEEAYDLAERLNPAQQVELPPQPQAEAPKPDLTAQTRKGNLSIKGAPSPGSNPSNRKPPSSARESLDRAFADMGL